MLEKLDLFVGKKISSPGLDTELISWGEDYLEVLIKDISWSYFDRYIDVGKTYKLKRHMHWDGSLLLWEIPPNQMKRNVSQLLLQWESEIGWSWDLDS